MKKHLANILTPIRVVITLVMFNFPLFPNETTKRVLLTPQNRCVCG